MGIVLHFMFFFGSMISIFTKLYRWRHIFVDRLNSIHFLLKDWQLNEVHVHKVLEYYKVFWDRRMGLRKPPVIFKSLPLPLQREVSAVSGLKSVSVQKETSGLNVCTV